jgi:DNA-binding GntR family transcriptional regulator
MNKHENVAAFLRLDITTGIRWTPGEQIPSQRSLAAEYDVSTATIYRAINILIRQGHLVTRDGHTYVAGATPRPRPRLHDNICERILNLAVKGATIPGASTLAAYAHCSGATARRALVALRREGRITRNPDGTYVGN